MTITLKLYSTRTGKHKKAMPSQKKKSIIQKDKQCKKDPKPRKNIGYFDNLLRQAAFSV